MDKFKTVNFEDVKDVTSEEYFSKEGFAEDMFNAKYSLEKSDGNKETPAEVFWRIAIGLAEMETTEEDKLKYSKVWFSLLWAGWWRPGGSVMSGVGNQSKISLNNCTTVSLNGDSLEDINECDYNVMKCAAFRQGLGVDVSNLRPRGAKINNAAVESTGIVPWVGKIVDNGKYVGQCLHENTQLLMSNGDYVKIKEIVEGKQSINILGDTDNVDVIDWFINDKKKLFEVTTEYGDKLVSSKDHVYKVVGKNGIYKKTLQDIDIENEFLLCRRVTIDKQYVKIPKFIYEKSNYNNSNRLFIPKILPKYFDEDIAYLCGNIYGDGCEYNGIIELALADDLPEVTDKINDILKKLFGFGIGDYGFNIRKGDGALHKLSINRFVTSFFKKIGVIKQKGGSMTLPEILKKSPKSVVLSFFAGLFDADGYNSMTKKNVELTLIDYKFLYDLKLQLYRCGIILKLVDKKKIPIGENDRLTYKLSIVGKRSMKSLSTCGSIKLNRGNLYGKYDHLKTPYTLKDIDIENKSKLKEVSYTQYIPDETYEKLIGEISNYYIQKIKTIKSFGRDITYDITVNNSTHMFLANNIIVSNSGRMPALLISLKVDHPDIEEFIVAKTKLGVIEGANISVQITNSFMDAVENDEDWELHFDFDNETKYKPITKIVKAKELFHLIAKTAHECLHKDETLLVNIDGKKVFKSISDLYNLFKHDKKFKVYSFNNDKLCLEEKEITFFSKKKTIQKMLTVYTNKGVILATENHPVFKYNVDAELITIPLNKLSMGDKIVHIYNEYKDSTIDVINNINMFSSIKYTSWNIEIENFLNSFPWNCTINQYKKRKKCSIKFLNENNYNGSITKLNFTNTDRNECLNFPINITEEISILSGLLIGDGDIKKTNLRIHCNNKEVTDIIKLINNARKSLNLNSEVTIKVDNYSENGSTIMVYDSILSAILKELCYINSKKNVTDYFMFGSLNNKLNFLRGWFSADGTVTNKRAVLCVCNDLLANQVVNLFNLIDVPYKMSVNLTKGKEKIINGKHVSQQNCYKIQIDDTTKFRNKVFIYDYKNNKLKNKLIYNYPIPIMGIKGRKSITKNTKKQHISFKIKKFINRFEDNTLVDYASILKIREEVYNDFVYDITVQDNHNFINKHGILLKNCAEPGFQAIDLMKEGSMVQCVANATQDNRYEIVSTNACCITKDANIFLDSGIKKLRDLVDKKKFVSITNEGTTVVDKILPQGKKKIYELKTTEGVTLDCTFDHKIKKTSGELVESGKLEKGDLLAIPNNDFKPLKINYKDFDIGFFVGATIHGNFEKENKIFSFSINEKEIKLYRYLNKLFVKYFNYGISTKTSVVGKKIKVKCRNTTIYEQLLEFGLLDSKIRSREVPQFIYKSKSLLIGFLNGVFNIKCNTSLLNKTHLSINFLSFKLLKQIQEMLLYFGIRSTTYTNDGRPYLEIENNEFVEFHSIMDYKVRSIVMKPLRKIVKSVPVHSPKRYLTFDSIKYKGVEEVYDLINSKTGTFTANGLVISNSEKPLPAYGVCNLASINMEMFSIEENEYKEELENIIPYLVRLSDNVVTYELKNELSPIEKQAFMVKQLRELGMGITNLHGWLLKQNVAYDSDEAVERTEKFFKHYAYIVFKTSIELGKEKGNSPGFELVKDKNEFMNSIYFKNIVNEFFDGKATNVTHMRNMAHMSIAPTGSLSNSFPYPCISSGVEPVIGLYYWRKTRAINTNLAYTYYFVIPNRLKDFILSKMDKNTDDYKQLNEFPGSLQDEDGKIGEGLIKIISKYVKDGFFKPAHEIDYLKKIKLMSKLYNWVDAAISCTYNLSRFATVEDVETIYMEAYKHGIRAVSVYVDGCREGILIFESPVIDRNKAISKDFLCSERPDQITLNCAPKRPKELECNIHQISIKGEMWTVLVGLLNGLPFEVFCGQAEELYIPKSCKQGKIIKQGKSKYSLEVIIRKSAVTYHNLAATLMTNNERALTRLLSLNLRHGILLQFIVGQLKKSNGDITDFATAISRVLSIYIKEMDYFYKKGEKTCPICGKETMIFKGGCMECIECSHSKCG